MANKQYQDCDRYAECSKLTTRVVTLEVQMKDLQEEKIVTRERVRDIEKVVWKAIGAVGVGLALVEVLLKYALK
jgi:hypothetical protein